MTFTSPGTYLVELEASNFLGSSIATMSVTVTAASAVDFTTSPNPAAGAPGLNVTFADASTPGGTSYAWTFGAGQGGVTNPTNASVSHQYNTAGTFTVTLDGHLPDRRREREQDRHDRRLAVHRPEPQRRQVQRGPGRLDGRMASPASSSSRRRT